MDYSAVIVAAGSGTRMGLGYNKVYYEKDGITILERTLRVFLEDEDCREVIAVTDPELFREKLSHLKDARIRVVSGGATRQESVTNGVLCTNERIVMIHDGARPYLSQECLNRLKECMRRSKAACLMVPCKDTIKRVADGYIVETIPRAELMAAQTPQVFDREILLECLKKAREDHYTGTDDCSVVEKYADIRIAVVEGDYENLKITTPDDLR